MKDVLGRELQPGDYVVYPARKSSAMWVRLMEVLQVGDKVLIGRAKDVGPFAWSREWAVCRVVRLDRVVKVEAPP
jgi:hypothetical protein